MGFKRMEKGNGTSSFIRLQDGESITTILIGEPYYYKSVWSPDGEILDEKNGKPKFRINAICKENGVYVAKCLSSGPDMNDKIMAFEEEGYTVGETVFVIKRHGSGKTNTKYEIVPKPGKPSNLDQIKAVKLLDLSSLGFQKSEVSESINFDGDIPF